MKNVELFKTMFSEDEFNSLLNTNEELIKDLSTDEWKKSTKYFVSGYRKYLLKNNVLDKLNLWHVECYINDLGWIYEFSGNTYDELTEIKNEKSR